MPLPSVDGSTPFSPMRSTISLLSLMSLFPSRSLITPPMLSPLVRSDFWRLFAPTSPPPVAATFAITRPDHPKCSGLPHPRNRRIPHFILGLLTRRRNAPHIGTPLIIARLMGSLPAMGFSSITNRRGEVRIS